MFWWQVYVLYTLNKLCCASVIWKHFHKVLCTFIRPQYLFMKWSESNFDVLLVHWSWSRLDFRSVTIGNNLMKHRVSAWYANVAENLHCMHTNDLHFMAGNNVQQGCNWDIRNGVFAVTAKMYQLFKIECHLLYVFVKHKKHLLCN